MTSKESPLVSSLEKILSKPVFQKAIAKALAESLASTFEDIQQDRADLADHMAQAATPTASQTGKREDRAEGETFPREIQGVWTEPWIPKVGDWVKINAPDKSSFLYNKSLEGLDGEVFQVVESAHGDKRYAALQHDDRLLYVRVDLLGPAKPSEPDTGFPVSVIQMPQPPEGWRLLGNNEVLRKGDKRFNVHGKAWDLERGHIGDLVSDKFNTRFIRRNTFAIGERVVVVGVVGYPSQDIYRALENSKITPPSIFGRVRVVCETNQRKYEFCADVLAPYFEDSK
jgi:hypothetical protein